MSARFIPTWFKQLRDCPTSYIGHAGKSVTVKSDESGLQFTTPSGGGSSKSDTDLYLVTEYGAVADGKNVQSGAITAGSNILNINVRTTTSPTTAPGWKPPDYESQFTFLDIGKNIILTGAGAGGSILKTTITGCNSTTQVTLAVAASTTVTTDMPVSWGTDNTAAFQSALDDVVQIKKKGTIGVPNGKYLFLGYLEWPKCDLINGGLVGGSISFKGINSAIPELYSYRDVTAPVLMITDEVNNFIQFKKYAKTVYGTLNVISAGPTTISNLVFYHPNQIKVTGDAAASTPLTYPWTISTDVGGVVNISIRDCLFVNSYKAIFYGSTRGNLHNLKIGAFNTGIEIDGIYDFVFIEDIEILPAFAAFIEGLGAGGTTNVELTYCRNNLYGMIIKYCDALTVKGFTMFNGYAGIYCTTSSLGSGYGSLNGLHLDSVYHGIIIDNTKGPGWSIVDYHAEIFSYSGTSAIWLKAGGLVGAASWTGGGYYNSGNNPIKADAGITGTLKISNVNYVPDMAVAYMSGTEMINDRTAIAIGTRTPKQALDVRGNIKIGKDTTVFTSVTGGEMRYDSATGKFQGYNGITLTWDNLN